MQLKMGGKFHLKLNMGTRPIANKYREGKMKSTLKRELIERETVERETIEEISSNCDNQYSFECALVTFAVQHGFSLKDKDSREVVLIFGLKCYKLGFLL